MLKENSQLPMNTVVEIPIQNQERIDSAMTQEPINQILFQDGRFSSKYETAMNNVDIACCANNTCAHGWNHILWVANNFFSLVNIANEGVSRNGLLLMPGEFSQKYSDSVAMFPIMEHDLSYGSNEVIWNGNNAENHHVIAQHKLREIREKWISVYDKESQHSLEIFDSLFPLYEKTVGIDTKVLLEKLKEAEAHQTMSSELLFISLFKLADVFDYYRAKRLEGLEKEAGNGFFDFASQVSHYFLTYDNERVYFNVNLKEMDKEMWYHGTKALYPEVWDLATVVSGILGRKFVIQEAA